MRKFLISIVLGITIILTGCHSTETASGYFFVKATSLGYTVCIDSADFFGTDTMCITDKNLTIGDAISIADRLNRQVQDKQRALTGKEKY